MIYLNWPPARSERSASLPEQSFGCTPCRTTQEHSASRRKTGTPCNSMRFPYRIRSWHTPRYRFVVPLVVGQALIFCLKPPGLASTHKNRSCATYSDPRALNKWRNLYGVQGRNFGVRRIALRSQRSVSCLRESQGWLEIWRKSLTHKNCTGNWLCRPPGL